MHDMPRKLPLNVIKEKNRHGNWVYYYREGKGPRTRMRAEPGTSDFEAEYKRICAGAPVRTRKEVKDKRSLQWLVDRYMESRVWSDLSVSTRKQRSNIFTNFLEKAGKSAFADVSKQDIERAIERRSHTPAQANCFLKAVRGVYEWAVKSELAVFDPTHGVDRLSDKTDGFEPWTSEDVHLFCVKWPIGSMQRLALELLMFSGLRRSDIVRAGRQHMTGNVFSIRTKKTNTEVTVEFPQRLLDVISQTKTGDLNFIISEHGTPFTVESFGNWFRKHCRKAGVFKSAHGVRKLSATMAANAGASSHELMAQYGWATSRQAETYTKKADRKRLGVKASQLVAEQIEKELSPHLNPSAGNIANSAMKSKAAK